MPSSPPTALISWAHAADAGRTDGEWRDEVLQFAVNLRHFGVDADLDLFHLSEVGVDWSRWGPGRIKTFDYTLIVLNHAWAERFEGSNLPTVGAGAAAEANTLLGLFSKDQHDFQRRVLVVVLPSASRRDLPLQLSGLQRFELKELSREGLTPLLRLFHDQPEIVPPAVGEVPVLSQQQFARIDEEFGTPGRHVPVPGVPVEGQDVVQQQIASNSTGEAVRGLLEKLAGWPGVAIRGRRPRGAPQGSGDDFSSYLRIVLGGSTVGYLYASSGRLNPKVAQAGLSDALSAAPAARRVTSSNDSYQLSINVTDDDSRDQALQLLAKSAGLT